MPNIIKSSTGLMFSEEFNGKISLLWDLSPNEDNRVANNSNSISLLHGDEKIKMLLDISFELTLSK